MPHTEPTQAPVFSQAVSQILGRRDDTAFRSDVTKARTPASEHFAYRHLAQFWASPGTAWAKQPTLVTGAFMCDFRRIAHTPGRSFGQALAVLAFRNGTNTRGRIETRLTAMQNQRLAVATNMLRPLLAEVQNANLSIDWYGLAKSLFSWDHPDPTRRRQARRRLLEDFYRQQAATPNTTDTSTEE